VVYKYQEMIKLFEWKLWLVLYSYSVDRIVYKPCEFTLKMSVNITNCRYCKS